MLASAPRLAALALVPLVFTPPASGQVWLDPEIQLAPSPLSKARYGRSAAISGDTLAVSQMGFFHSTCAGVYSPSEVYVYDRGPGGGWDLTAVLPVPPPECVSGVPSMFGYELVLDGDTLVVAAEQEGQVGVVRIYERNLGGLDAWGLAALKRGQHQYRRFGDELAISGDTIAIGNGGVSVHIFERDAGGPGAWGSVVRLTNSQSPIFGSSLDLEGDLLAIGGVFAGTTSAGEVYLHERNRGGSNQWGPAATVTGSAAVAFDGFARDLALDGTHLFVAAEDQSISGRTGVVYVFERDAGGPDQWGEILSIAPNQAAYKDFGSDIDAQNGTLVVGLGWNGINPESAVLVYERDLGGPQAFGLAQKFELGEYARFRDGESLSISGDTLVTGASITDIGMWQHVTSLALDPNSDTLYGLSPVGWPAAPAELMRMDLATGDLEHIGPLESSRGYGLAFDPASSTLYAVVDNGTPHLVVLDPDTGLSTMIGALDPGGTLNITGLSGLTFDTVADVLFGSSGTELVRIDPSSGAATVVGPMGSWMAGLTCSPGSGQLFGVGSSALHTIDAATGASTPVHNLIEDYEGLSFDASTGLLIAADPLWDAWRTIDPITGVETHLAWVYVQSAGRAYLWEREKPVSYCTAGTSTHGCQASVSVRGFPSASHASGFELLADQVDGGAEGLFFYGTGPAQALPWSGGSGFQCIAPPVRRTPLLPGNGSAGACDGSLAFDLNAHWSAKPTHYPGPSQTVRAQLWYRDAGTTGTNLSDAVQFLTAP